MKFVFIENPIAGNKSKKNLFMQVESAFRLSEHEMIIEETNGPKHAIEIAKKYADMYGKDAVIVSCGGDGTVHEIANGLAGKDTPMMVLPLGTGNDFAKKVYGTKKINIERVVKSFGLHNGKIKYDVMPIDLIDYNGEKCINVMSYGLDTKIETLGRKIAAKFPKLKSNAYTVAVIPAILGSMAFKINVDFDCIDENGKPFKITNVPMDYTLMAICNASYYGGGFCPAPNSKLDDGILNLTYLDPVNLAKAIPLIPRYNNGVADEYSDLVHTEKIVGGRVWSADENNLLGNCDGENFDYKEVVFKVEPKALNLCVIKE